MGGVAVHLVEVLDPSDALTAARYVQMAREAVAIIPASRQLLFTAGTGMYLKAYLEDLDLGGMGAVPELRETFEAEAARDLPALARRLVELSPGLAARTDLQNPVRVVRRMELLVAAAFAEDSGSARDAGERRPTRALKVGLAVAPGILDERITHRIDRMLVAGWKEEVEALLRRRPAASSQVMNSIGVAEMAAHLRGEVDQAQLRELVRVRTRQYAKRQRTWFRADSEVRWVDAGDRPPSDIVESILEMLN